MEADQVTTEKPVFQGRTGELQQRDELHLQLARKILLEEGFHEVTIARLSRLTGFSRGTLYQRFGSREGLVAELGIECQKELMALIQEAARLPGRTRERFVAMGAAFNLYAQRYLDNTRILAIIRAETISERVRPEILAEIENQSVGLFNVLVDIAQEGIAQGDLELPEGMRSQTLCLTFWTMVNGCAVAMRGVPPLDRVDISDPLGELTVSMNHILDAFGWRPLSTEWNYEETLERATALLSKADSLRAQKQEERAP